MTKKITLHYFDARGVAEPHRYLLAYAKVDYVDHRFSWEEWPQIKPTMPGGKVPVLEVDGKMLSQSTAILVYLANEYGLAGKGSWEVAKLQEIDGVIKDVNLHIMKWFYEPDESKKPQLFADMCEKGIPEGVAILVKQHATLLRNSQERIVQLDQNNKFILGGDTPTWGDFQLAGATERFAGVLNMAGKELNSKILAEHLNRIHALPGVKEYLPTRPQNLGPKPTGDDL